MVKFGLKALAGLLAAFVLQAVLRSGFQQLVGSGMLEAAAWSPGDRPPGRYMVFTVMAALTATGMAGVAAALIVGRARFRHATACGLLLAVLAGWANRATLLHSPHPYEWPLILAPLIAMPLGALLVMRLKPLPPDASHSVPAS